MTRRLISSCLALGLAEYLLYSVNFRKFFQGDALFWMQYRFRSAGEFLGALGTLDIAHWYRPLSNRIIPSLFYPVFGLQPLPYHLIVFASFFKLSCLVFLFFYYLTRNTAVAFIGAFYFSIHSINVYPAYDFAFSPEVFYVFFYVASVWLFIEAERRESCVWRAASVVVFGLSLMSKEAAVTLPAMLVLSYLVFLDTSWKRALRATVPHAAILAAYMFYIVGFLRVGAGDYMLGLSNLPRNLVSSVYYVFNFRTDGYAPTRDAPGFIVAFLAVFAMLQVLLAVQLIRRPERKLLVFGLSWFVIGLGPMLLLNVFGPYYTLLGMVGVSLFVGTTLGTHVTSRPVVAAILFMLWISCRSVIVSDTAGDTALGQASVWAEASMADVLAARPDLPSESTIYIFDEAVPNLWRFHGLGSLFKLAYGDDSIKTSYRTAGAAPRSDSGELVVFKAEDGHLIDVTEEFEAEAGRFLSQPEESTYNYRDVPGVTLTVMPQEVVAGRDFYWLTVTGLKSPDVVVAYTVNNGPVAEATFHLNPDGKIRFFVSELTEIGQFRFVRFREATARGKEWIRSNATLRVLEPAH